MSDKTNVPAIRTAGERALAEKREINTLTKAIAGMTWGNVSGGSFSAETRYMLAQFCQITGANPLTQVDILGGKPYLNANFWSDRITKDPVYIDHQFIEISVATEETYRNRAEEYRSVAVARKGADDSKGAASALAKALEYEEKADYCADARGQWSPPAWASSVVECIIRRFMNAAPMDAIRAGEIPMSEAEQWIVSVKECNWAGNRPEKAKRSGGSYDADPIGNEEPEKTARTRALRRCAARAFPAWSQEFEEHVQEAQRVIDADWTEVHVQEAPPAPATVSTRSGEAEAAPKGSPLERVPVEGDWEVEEAEVVREPEPEPKPEPEPEDDFDRADARKKLFATLRDAGVADSARKEWSKDHGLPASTSLWSKDDYERAFDLLITPTVDEVKAAVAANNIDLEDLSLRALGKSNPQFLKDWQAILGLIQATATKDADMEGDL